MANMRINFVGQSNRLISAKDLILALIRQIGTAGGTGYTIEYAGEAIRQLSMEGRFTLCNMTIEAGARAGLVAVDDKTIDYLHGRPMSPKGDLWDQAVARWRGLKSDDEAQYDQEIEIDINHLAPQVSWGTSPEMVIGIDEVLPALDDAKTSQMKPVWRLQGPVQLI